MRSREPEKRKSTKKKVILTGLPPGFLDDLPLEDQLAIRAVVGKPVTLNQYDADGRADLEFAENDETGHFIYVDPKFIEPCS